MNSRRYLSFCICILILALHALSLNGCDSVSQSPEEEEPVEKPDSVSLDDKLVVRYMNLTTDEKGGDAIIIQTPGGLTMMIDAGRTSVGSQVDQYLDKLDIQTIDYAITTHPHIDHIGGYLTLLDTKQIDQFLMPNVTHTASYYEELIDKLEENEIDQAYLEEGDTMSLGNEIEIKVFSPPEGTEPPNSTSIQAINDLSVVLKITFGETTFLFTGDINMNREGKLIDSFGGELSADILHAPHHGMDTSSSLNFIQTVDPALVVISENRTEEINSYVYERYENYGSDIYVTGRDGHITLASDGNDVEIILKNKKTVSGKYSKKNVGDPIAVPSF